MNLNSSLTQLEDSQLVRRLTEEDLAYIFKHALTQQAAYASLLKQERKRLHLNIAETLERLYPEHVNENAALLARHFDEGGECEKAVAYLRRAARQAVERYAYAAAVGQLSRALELIGEKSESRVLVLEELGDVHRLLREGQRALALYRESLDGWRHVASADKMIAVRLHRKIVETLSEIKWAIATADFYAESRATLSSVANLEAELQTRERAPDPEVARLLTALSVASWRIQTPPDWEAALRYAQAAVEIAEKLDNPVDMSAPLDALANVYFARGLLRETLDISLRRLAISQHPSFQDERERLDSERGVGGALTFIGEYAEAIPHLFRARDLAQRVQAIDQEFNAYSLLSLGYLRLDRWDDVLRTETHVRDLASRYPREKTGPT